MNFFFWITIVGREQELGLLMDRWEQVKEKMGHVVLLNGEAGIGKSRIVRVLEERVAEDPQAWLVECHCSPYHQNTAFYPVVDLFERVILQFDRDDTPQDKLSKVEGFLVQYGLPLDETVPLFSTLLSVPLGNSYSPLNLTPQQQKVKILQMLLEILLKRASQQPVLFVVEDLHWADASSVEFLDLLMDQVPTVPIFTVLSFRPSFTPHWTGRSYLSSITLNRLTRRQVADMVEHIAGKPLPVQVTEQLVTKTDGVPLFIEELTRMVLESGLLREQDDSYELIGLLPPLAIPRTLQDSLMARLDRLATVKEVAQLGSVVGREFTYELLKTVSTLDEETLQKALSRLVDSELLYQRGLPPQSTYIFKHILICDTAYDSLLKGRRQQYHQQIAMALEREFPDIAEAQPQIVAYHYTSAGLSQQAIPYWHKAGQQAVKRSANVEAIAHLRQGLELLKSLPETPERIQQELGLQVALGAALAANRGYASPEVEATFDRARKLCRKLGDVPQTLPVLWGLWVFYTSRGDVQIGRELAEQNLNIAHGTQDPLHLIETHAELGSSLFYLGEFGPALKHLEHSYSLYDPEHHHFHIYVRHPVAFCLFHMACVQTSLGYLDKALKTATEALKMGQGLAHPYTLAMTLMYVSYVHYLRREENLVCERAEAQIALSTEQGFPHFLAMGNVFYGWVVAQQAETGKGIAQIQHGLDSWRTIGMQLGVPSACGMLADALGKAGLITEGLSQVSQGLAVLERNDDRYYEAELYRLKGELMLMRGADETEVEACFEEAIRVAQRQQARFFELKTKVGMSRLWQKQGKVEEARKMLQEIYDWFTEGFDTKDLLEAKVLLEELSSG